MSYEISQIGFWPNLTPAEEMSQWGIGLGL